MYIYYIYIYIYKYILYRYSSNAITTTSSNSKVKSIDSDDGTDKVQELLLKCITRTTEQLIFEYFPTHRKDQMQQSNIVIII